MDEIRLTPSDAFYPGSFHTSLDQTHQLDQILHPETRPTASHAQIRVCRHCIRPTHRDRAAGPVSQLHRDPLFPPEPLPNHQAQAPPSQRVKRVDYSNELLSGFTMCI